MHWYVSQNGKTTGPFTEQRVAMLLNWGKISSNAYLCDEKWSCWVAITRSQFAPLLSAQELEQSAGPQQCALSELPADQSGWFGHRLALTLLLMLTAAAFLLALWLAPGNVASAPLGQLLGEGAPARASASAPPMGEASAWEALAAPAHPHSSTAGLQPTTRDATRAARSV